MNRDQILAKLPRISADCLARNGLSKPPAVDMAHDPHDVRGGQSADAWDSRFFAGIPVPVAEYRFHKTRKWRFDYAWPAEKVALEIEGGVWTGGRHTRGTGFLRDIEKYNSAAVAGWTVLRCTPDTLATPRTLAMLREALADTQGHRRGTLNSSQHAGAESAFGVVAG